MGINKKFFSKWTSEMSYILGMIVADGCIVVKRIRKDGSKQYSLEITNKSLFLMRRIKKAMKARQRIGVKQGSSKEKCYRLQIGHQEICRDLLKLKILPRKTYTQFNLDVPEKYFSDFVRGFFDGDGSVYIYQVNGTPQIKANFASTSLPFISQLNRRLCKRLNIPLKTIHREFKKGSTIFQYVIYFYVDDCEKLAKFMYGKNPTLYLPYKRQVFEKWKLVKRRPYIKRNYPSKIGCHLNQKGTLVFKGKNATLL